MAASCVVERAQMSGPPAGQEPASKGGGGTRVAKSTDASQMGAAERVAEGGGVGMGDEETKLAGPGMHGPQPAAAADTDECRKVGRSHSARVHATHSQQ